MLFSCSSGRAAATGQALSLVCVDEHKLLRDIERLLKREVPRMAIPGFEPDPTIPAEPIQNGRDSRGGGRGRGQSPRGGQSAGRGQPQGQRRSEGGAPKGERRGGGDAAKGEKPSRRLGDAAKPAGDRPRRPRPRKPASAQ